MRCGEPRAHLWGEIHDVISVFEDKTFVSTECILRRPVYSVRHTHGSWASCVVGLGGGSGAGLGWANVGNEVGWGQWKVHSERSSPFAASRSMPTAEPADMCGHVRTARIVHVLCTCIILCKHRHRYVLANMASDDRNTWANGHTFCMCVVTHFFTNFRRISIFRTRLASHFIYGHAKRRKTVY